MSLGLSGSVAKKFLRSEITPLLALVGFLLGVFAVAITPREEEPQIDVTFANVFIPFPGASASEVENLITNSAEQVMSEIEGIKHIYSISRPGVSVLTVQFKVGEAREDAIIRLYNAVFSNQDWLPAGLGVAQPIIKPMGIDDVPIVTGTLWSKDPNIQPIDLLEIAHTIESELKRVPGTRDIYTIGGPDRIVSITLTPEKLSAYNLSVSEVARTLQLGNQSVDAGELVQNNRAIAVQAGEFFSRPEEIADLVISVRDGIPIFLKDVAEVKLGVDDPENYVWMGTGPQASTQGIDVQGEFPAITIAVAKKPGENAVQIADQLIERFEQIQGTFVPDGIEATITRNYGQTANDKAQTLIGKLAFATSFVVLLVLVALGWREALVVGTAVVVTLAITLFASWSWGFTLNRVSLFALIFSIGILVDDAIVVVENIHRKKGRDGKTLEESIPEAVDEVGGPTILATFTVIAALLPMAFVSGLMGPYMSPIPINASIGMLISLIVAFVVTPWLAYRVFKSVDSDHSADDEADGKMYRLFSAILKPFLRGKQGRKARVSLTIGILVLILGSMGLVGIKAVVLKMLPFDNKSEFQVVVDLPEGTAVERTAQVLSEMGQYLAQVPEVTHYQAYAGSAAPINFNGLVRQYYLRQSSNLGDIQVNLIDKSQRDRKSHEIALSVRESLLEIANKYDAVVNISEVPPGPPVMAPLVAEVYGLDYNGQIKIAKSIREFFDNTKDIVDVDDSVEIPSPRWIIQVNRHKAAILGLSQNAVTEAVGMALGGIDLAYLHDDNFKTPVPIRMEFPVDRKADLNAVLDLHLQTEQGSSVALSEIVTVRESLRENVIYHKDLLPVVYVTGNMAGALDSPLYGMFDIYSDLKDFKPQGDSPIPQYFVNQPENPYRYGIKWDGEWQITYETFRDMGIAYSVGLILIYLLVVGQFKSYLVPLIIMAPIPLTIIGVMPGHALLDKHFTATSMIGMIALAGIIVRNSILLVDFINEQVRAGIAFDEAVIRSGAVRARPIALTGLAAMLGAFFILDDPIFSGLAISLIFGILVSTILTLVVIPIMYYAFFYKRTKDLL